MTPGDRLRGRPCHNGRVNLPYTRVCPAEAADITWTRSAVFLMFGTIESSIRPAFSANSSFENATVPISCA